MSYRTLGSGPAALEVSKLGLGCMGMSYAYGPADESESLRVLHRYVALGGIFLDTAEVYGPHRNEELIGRFLREVPRIRAVVATKFGFRIEDGKVTGLDGTPQNAVRACEASLQRLGLETVDLFYLHRVDPAVPIEETVGAMAELVRAGKVRRLGLSEVSAETIRRAHAVHPITAVQSEWSLWTRDVEQNGVLAACRELGIGFVPYSPLGRGFLTGKIASPDQLTPGDWRRLEQPRFEPANFTHNLALVDRIRANAAGLGCTAGQLALAWVLAQGKDVVPIPGTKRLAYLEENMATTRVRLKPDDLAALDADFPPGSASGERYAPAMMARVHA